MTLETGNLLSISVIVKNDPEVIDHFKLMTKNPLEIRRNLGGLCKIDIF